MNRTLIITLLAAFAILPIGANAQQLFDLGLKGGVSLDDLTARYTHEPIMGGNVGVFARLKPPVLPGVQGELLITSLGTRTTVEGVGLDVRTLAVQLPVFGILSLGPVEFHGGAYFERYLSRDIAMQQDLSLEGVAFDPSLLATEGYGLLVGAGVHLGAFYAGARYNLGMSSLGTGPYLGDLRSRQMLVYIGIGFMGADE